MATHSRGHTHHVSALPANGGPGPVITAPTPAQVALLTKASDAVPSTLQRLDISQGPTGSGGSDDPNWLNVTHPVEAATPAQVVDIWDGQTIAAAYELQCKAAGVPCLDGISFTTARGNVDGDFANPVAWTTVSPPVGSTGSIGAAIAQNATAAGLNNVTVTFDSLDRNLFPIVTGVADDPASFLKGNGPTAVFSGLSFASTLLTIDDSAGSVIYAAGLSGATGTGNAWVLAKYEPDTPHFTPPPIPQS
jgi:hypothetical protein